MHVQKHAASLPVVDHGDGPDERGASRFAPELVFVMRLESTTPKSPRVCPKTGWNRVNATTRMGHRKSPRSARIGLGGTRFHELFSLCKTPPFVSWPFVDTAEVRRLAC